jgi:hypothetical protein
MEWHAQLRYYGVSRVVNLDTIHDLFALDLREERPFAETPHNGKIGYWGHDSDLTALQSGKVKHPLLNEDGTIRLEMVGEKGGVNENLHDSSITKNVLPRVRNSAVPKGAG